MLIAGVALLERHYQHELVKLGWLPKTQLNKYPYGRKLSGYSVSQNTPNYIFNAYDDNLKPAFAQTDSNGFLTDGTVLSKTKDSGTIRIFITGGSTAWGSLESQGLMHDSTYPEGSYCYKATIAGKLQALLQAKYPRQKFEVIDAAVVMFRFHQSMALYFEKLHDFNPDIIINIDGNNDQEIFWGTDNTDPYLSSAPQFEEELQLETIARLPQFSYTLLYYNFKNMMQQGKPRKIKLIKRGGPDSNQRVILHEPSLKSYQTIRQVYKLPPKIFWLIGSYQQQLRADKVYSIFCLQPTLQRRQYQKQLSPTELRLRNILETITAADTAKLNAYLDETGKADQRFKDLCQQLGPDKYFVKTSYKLYALSEVSPFIDSITIANGGAFVDVNKAMTTLGPDKEFFMDYCHLTPYGNCFVAQLLFNKVETYLQNKGVH